MPVKYSCSSYSFPLLSNRWRSRGLGVSPEPLLRIQIWGGSPFGHLSPVLIEMCHLPAEQRSSAMFVHGWSSHLFRVSNSQDLGHAGASYIWVHDSHRERTF